MSDIEIFYVAFTVFFVAPVALVLWAVIVDHQSTTNRVTTNHQSAPTNDV
jgi:hypothetical protein